MVKKIRILDEPEETKQLSDTELKTELLDLLKAIDWKLWELLKIEQQKQKNDE
jgi:hypothetical protein